MGCLPATVGQCGEPWKGSPVLRRQRARCLVLTHIHKYLGTHLRQLNTEGSNKSSRRRLLMQRQPTTFQTENMENS